MNKTVQRILMFAIGLPLELCLILLFPHKNHLAANSVIIVLSALGALEFNKMIGRGTSALSVIEVLLLGTLPVIGAVLHVSFGLDGKLVTACFLIGAVWLLISRVLSKEEKFGNALERISSGFSIMIYPGFFMIWIIKMSLLPESSLIILVFLLMVVASDSLAWFFGMLLGNGNRGFIQASPNKSIAGFIGGIAGSVLVGIASVKFWPGIFTSTRIKSVLLGGIILGFVTSLAAIFGDLAESVMKRSSNMKDSGNVILGRGGILDSIDSIAFAAPVFYALYWFLFR